MNGESLKIQTAPKVMIVCTVPYREDATSRALASYFGCWPSSRLAQFFSNSKTPANDFCGTLFQITDSSLLRKRFKKSTTIGRIFDYSTGFKESQQNNYDKANGFERWLYRVGTRKSALNHLLRRWLWKKSLWNTPTFNAWLDNFKPDVVFCSFSDDFFILEISLYIAKKFSIPLIYSTGDDYYFNDHFSLLPSYHIYRRKYKHLVDEIIQYSSGGIYISDKIREKYDSYFRKNGQTAYLSSQMGNCFIERSSAAPTISYFGNVGLGRYKSLIQIGRALFRDCPGCELDIYSSEKDRHVVKLLSRSKGIRYHGYASYDQVKLLTAKSDLLVIAEGFGKGDISSTRFSLSTKVADSVSSGIPILAFGPEESGTIGFLKDHELAFVANSIASLDAVLKDSLFNIEKRALASNKENEFASQHFSLDKNNSFFLKFVLEVVDNHGKH